MEGAKDRDASGRGEVAGKEKGGVVTAGSNGNEMNAPAGGAGGRRSDTREPTRPIQRELYRAADGFVESEIQARRALQERDRVRGAVGLAPEPEGIDSYMPSTVAGSKSTDGRALTVMRNGVEIPVSQAFRGLQVSSRTTPGYDLVRVGNFTEKTGRSTRHPVLS